MKNKAKNAKMLQILCYYFFTLEIWVQQKIHRITELDKTTFHYRIYYKILDKYNTNTTY